jgi:hypothetical protein
VEHECPYGDCDGVIKTPGWAVVESNLCCPKCKRKVEVEHECHFTEEGDCCAEWLVVPNA